MSSIVQPYIEKLKYIEGNLEKVAQDIIKKNAPNILFMLKHDQLSKAIDSYGKDIVHPSGPGRQGVPNYEEPTENYWAKQSPRPRKPKNTGSRYNMEWTGEFFDGLGIKTYVEGFTIFSSNGKKEYLEGVYNTKLAKLTEENNKEINETLLLPELYRYILNNFMKV